ncbi:MAG: CDP-alcohol phosphatidyltransferase family protein [Bacillota bacterium]
MKAIPNCISIVRIMLSLVLIFLKPLSAAFYSVYIICGLSDMIDGFIARKTGTSSRLGARLDSIADLIMTGVLLFILYPVVKLTSEAVIWIILIALVRLASMIVALKRFKTFAVLHTYGNKLTGILIFIFPILLPFKKLDLLMYIICFVASVSAIEELIIQLTSRQLNLDRQSILFK